MTWHIQPARIAGIRRNCNLLPRMPTYSEPCDEKDTGKEASIARVTVPQIQLHSDERHASSASSISSSRPQRPMIGYEDVAAELSMASVAAGDHIRMQRPLIVSGMANDFCSSHRTILIGYLGWLRQHAYTTNMMVNTAPWAEVPRLKAEALPTGKLVIAVRPSTSCVQSELSLPLPANARTLRVTRP